jgi:hypothetical protein
MLTDLFELNAIDEVTYKQQLPTDRSTSETITHSTEEVLGIFFNCRFCYVIHEQQYNSQLSKINSS